MAADFVPASEAGELLEGATPGPWEWVELHLWWFGAEPGDASITDRKLAAAAPRLAETVVIAAKVEKRRQDHWTVTVAEAGWFWHRCQGWHPHGCKSEPISPSEVAYIKEVGGNG